MAQFLCSPRAIRNFPVQVSTELHRALGQVALRLLVRRDEELVDERVRQPRRHGRFRWVLCETRLRLFVVGVRSEGKEKKTHLADGGQHEFQRELEHLEAHTCANQPLWMVLLFIYLLSHRTTGTKKHLLPAYGSAMAGESTPGLIQ
jgi:hypothetical protein